MDQIEQALRRVRRRPGRSVVTALTLAIGIGASTAAFAAVEGVLLRPLPVDRQDELVVVRRASLERGSLPIPFGPGNYLTVSRAAESLVAVAGFSAWGTSTTLVDGVDGSYPLDRVPVAGDFFGVLGTSPFLGRLLTAADDRVGAQPAAVLSHAAWRGRFAMDPGVIGASIAMNDRSYTIVGVGPEGLDFPRGVEIWHPVQADYADPQGTQRFVELHVLGRMGSGVDRGTVASDIERALEADTPAGSEPDRELEVVVRAFEDQVTGEIRPLLAATMAAAVVLLVAGMANAILFLLAAGRSAAHDAAVRTALGAERGDFFGRVVADAGVVSVLATVTGLALAWVALRALLGIAPAGLPRLDEVALSAGSVVWATLAGAGSALITGVVAGTVLRRGDPVGGLWRGGRGTTGRGWGASRALAGVQVALTVVSAVAAGLLVRTVVALDRVDPGFSSADMTAVSLVVPFPWMDVPPSYYEALDQVARELEARPGIVAVRPSLGPPLQQRLEVVVGAEGQTADEYDANPYVAIDAVMPGHFEAMGIPLIAGRGFAEADDRPDAEPVAVVDETLARVLWPGQDAVGRRIDGFAHPGVWFRVVGVVAATRYRDFLEPHPRAYYPIRRIGNVPPSALLVRTAEGSDPPIADLTREALLRFVPEVRVLSVQPVAQALRVPTIGRRFAASILVSFALATLLLAAIGVYGVFTVAVQERTREMGVRRALGAQRGNIVGLVLAATARVAVVGVAAGLICALWATRMVESLLYGVSATDPWTFIWVVAGSLVLALAAGLLPALRAASTSPMESLRRD